MQRLLACQREKNGGIYVDGDQWESMQGELASRKAELEELGEELANARIQALEAEKKLDDAREEADAQRELRVSAEKARDEALEGEAVGRGGFTGRRYKRTLILKKCSRRIKRMSACC